MTVKYLKGLLRRLIPNFLYEPIDKARRYFHFIHRFREPEAGFIRSSENTLKTCSSMILNKTHGAYVRFNDGDLRILSGRHNRHQVANHRLSSEMRSALKIVDERFLKGLGVSSDAYGYEHGMDIGAHKWPDSSARSMLFDCYQYFIGCPAYSSTALHYALVHDRELAISFFRILRNKKIIFVGGAHNKKETIDALLSPRAIITVPSRDAFDHIDNIEKEIKNYASMFREHVIVILSCGAMAKPLSARLFNDPTLNLFSFDLGSVLEVFQGQTKWTWVRIANLPAPYWQAFIASVQEED